MMKQILTVSRPFDTYNIGNTIYDSETIVKILASENADKVRIMEVEMKPVLIVLQPFDTYTIHSDISDPEIMAHILASENADKVQKIERIISEDAKKLCRQETIDKALAVNLADGIFIINEHNSWYSNKTPEMQINPFEIFVTATHAEIEDWIQRSKKLRSSCYSVGVAHYESIYDSNKRVEFEKSYDEFVNSNPGFSNQTYGHVVYISTASACF